MGKRGPIPKKIIDETWRPNLAYAVGLLVTDGCLSANNAIDLTSKDKELLKNFSKCLGIRFYIGTKLSGQGKKHLRIQFKNRCFYDFLISIGVTPAKSKTIKKIAVPEKYFFDFLRGCFDGDGSSYSYWDLRWKSSFMFYMSFASASRDFIDWIRKEIKKTIKISGHITEAKGKNMHYQLKYSKYESIALAKQIYRNENDICLTRKKLKIQRTLDMISKLEKKI